MPLSSPSFIARTVASTCLLATLGACMNLGPASVQAGRLSYAEAISTTEEQQILLALVRNRHDQHGSMLAVNSVTANIRIAASGSMQFGFGDNDDYSGNLVPRRNQSLKHRHRKLGRPHEYNAHPLPFFALQILKNAPYPRSFLAFRSSISRFILDRRSKYIFPFRWSI